MGPIQVIGAAVGIVAYLKGNGFSTRFQDSKGDDKSGSRDGLVLMKNGLVPRGVALFVLTILMASVSEGWSLRLLALVPVLIAGACMYVSWPAKIAEALASRGNSAEEIGMLRRSFAFYSLAMVSTFVMIGGSMIGA